MVFRENWKEGDKVRFCYPNAGMRYDRELARRHLKKGGVYTIAGFVLRRLGMRNLSRILLKEIPEFDFEPGMFSRL